LRYAIVGAAGQLGTALISLLRERVVWAGGRDRLDVRDEAAGRRIVSEVRPDVVINASAYNRVDAAESDCNDALAVNGLGPRYLARACAATGALLVHVSTDYVFDGSSERPYREDDCPRPINFYGLSKLVGELAVDGVQASHLIVRTSGVLGAGGSRAKGGSFVERILERARTTGSLRVVDDQRFSPTYAPDLAAAIVALVDVGAHGLVHVTNDGACSWYELAVAALETAGLSVPVERIRSSELGAAARRPASSALSNERYRGLGLPPLRHWREALTAMLSR
jgi:dTDP-4-dehydrorhamnose reductase